MGLASSLILNMCETNLTLFAHEKTVLVIDGEFSEQLN